MDDVLVPGGGRKYFSVMHTSVKREALQRDRSRGPEPYRLFKTLFFFWRHIHHQLAAVLVSPSLFVKLIHLLCWCDIGSFDLFIF